MTDVETQHTPMHAPLRTLVAFGYDHHAETLHAALCAAGFAPDVSFAPDERAYLDLLTQPPDLILAVDNPPGTGALRALELMRARGLSLPLLVLADAVDEQVAVECIRRGADDYLVSGRLDRLGQSVRRALEAHSAQHMARGIAIDLIAQEKTSQEMRKLARALEQSPVIVFIADAQGRLEYANHKYTEVTGRAPEEVLGQITRVLDPEKTSPAEHRERWEAIRAGREWSGDVLRHEQDGEPYWEYVKLSPILDADGTLTHIVVIKENITEHKLAQAAPQKRTEAVERLYEAGRRLGRTLDLGTIYQTIREVIAGAMPCDNLIISSYDPATGLIRCEAAWIDDNQLDASAFPPVPLNLEGKGTQSLAIHTGESVCLPDFDQQRRTSARQYHVAANGTVAEDYEACDEEIPRSALIVPCKLEDQAIGVLQVFSYRLDDYSPDDLRLLEALGPLVAAAMANARLYEQAQSEIAERQRAEQAEREQRALAEALSDIAALLNRSLDVEEVLDHILTHAGRVVPFDAAHIGLVEDGVLCAVRCHGYERYGGDEAVLAARLRVADFPSLRAMATSGQPYLIADVHADPGWIQVAEPEALRAYLGAPIMSGDTMLGVVSLMSETAGSFTQTQAQWLKALAHHAAIAIRNVQLYDRVQRYAADLEARVNERTEALRISEERARAQHKAVPVPAFLLQRRADGEFVLVDYNDAAYKFSEGNVTRWMGQTASAFHSTSPELIEMARECFEQRTMLQHEMYYTTPETGRQLYMQVTLTFLPPDLILIHSVDLTDRKQYEEVLRAALERERYLSKLRARLVTTVSHQFRTPLSIILSSAEILDRHSDKLTEDGRRRRFDHIREAIGRMVRLLDDVLELSSVQAGEAAVKPEPVDLAVLCAQVIARISGAKGHSVRTRLEALESPGLVLLDRRLFSQTLHHLVSNAVKFSRPGGEVVVRLLCQDEQIIIQVQDEGVGIPLADRSHVFDGFHRGSNVEGIPGTGLGLAIAKHNIELCGGTISFESEEGLGTTFTVTLPLSEAIHSASNGGAARSV
ncbi:MAG: GAF domain-containing protein [Chloroflexota bacterium]